MKRVNPRKRPANGQDVDRAFKRGRDKGIEETMIIVLYTLKDKFNAADTELTEFFNAFAYTVDSINKGYITEKDLQTVMKDEYDMSFVMR